MIILIVIRSHLRARAIPTSMFVSGPPRDLSATAILNSKNRRVKQETSGVLPLYQFHCRFFKLGFLKQIGHPKRDTRPETVTACPALPTYNYNTAIPEVNYLS